ncbi:MAG TPA: ATP synthase F1 subunit gamma [Desulfobacteraceae bacterium]|nr:ATP synthase F1 subunit gamma [Desulfobacteraceae bacterium]
MATLRDILRKINAVKRTRQITRAMNMVAAAKLRNTQGKMEGFEPYARKFSDVLAHLASILDPEIHPLLISREEVRRVELLFFTADRGLCGSFNTNSINRAEGWIKQQEQNGREITLFCIGKKGVDYFKKKNIDMTASFTQLYGKTDMAFINRMTGEFINRFLREDIDELYMLYTRFVSMLRYEPTLLKLLPISPPSELKQAQMKGTEYIYEPDSASLMIELLPKYISVQIYNAFLQNEVSEHAARMTAMDNATKNCDDMIENLTLLYNKARQASITLELLDIVGGAEAIKKA